MFSIGAAGGIAALFDRHRAGDVPVAFRRKKIALSPLLA